MTDNPQAKQAKPPLKQRLKDHLKEYGPIALGVYLAIFAVVYVAFLISISAGIGETDTAGTVGTAGAAWLATKVTQPLRIGATFLLTPLVARVVRRRPSEEILAPAVDEPAEQDE